MVKNRLKYWRHQLLIDTQTEFAKLLGVSHQRVSLWERQEEQPTLEMLIKIWFRIKENVPTINLQDLIEYENLE
ncbi:MAG TPA: helix-turn-helix transcriptional regulator [Syntrophomonadaceae bacterium]|nr:helix-turn-helix transcriptional regulator [Syntrophomonadaceae bacterium]